MFLLLSHLLQRFTLKFPEDHPEPTDALLEPDKSDISIKPKQFEVSATLR